VGHRARRRGVQMCFGLVVLVALAVIFVVLLGAAPRGSSANWSFGPFAGYVWRGQVTSVQGSWSVPRVLAGSSLRSAASTWIGAEAPGEPAPFIQIGTNEQRVSPAEVLERGPGYYAFWSDTKGAFHPRPFFRVSPGDDIRASLALARKRWTLAIVDTTSGASAHFSTGDETHEGALNEAAWTQEDVTDGTTGKPSPYPRLSESGFRHLAVNGKAPSYADLYSSWMSVHEGNLAPSPLHGDSFVLRRATVSSLGAQYLAIATRDDVASETFVAGFARWTTKTPYSQIESASVRFSGALSSNSRAFTKVRWPAPVRGLVHSLIADTGVLLEDSRPSALVSSAELAGWKSRWAHGAEAITGVAHAIKRTLNLPEIRPVT